MNQKPKQESKIYAEFRRIYMLEFGFVREFSVNFTNYRNYTKMNLWANDRIATDIFHSFRFERLVERMKR